MLESVKESGYVTKSNPTGKLLLESINVVFYHQSSPPVQSTSPVHQSSQVIVDYSSASFPCSSVCVQYDTRKRKSAKNGAYMNACLVPRPSSKEESSGGSRILEMGVPVYAIKARSAPARRVWGHAPPPPPPQENFIILTF